MLKIVLPTESQDFLSPAHFHVDEAMSVLQRRTVTHKPDDPTPFMQWNTCILGMAWLGHGGALSKHEIRARLAGGPLKRLRAHVAFNGFPISLSARMHFPLEAEALLLVIFPTAQTRAWAPRCRPPHCTACAR